jgi:hypothetical protein
MDLNSLIPELVETIEYGKGPYWRSFVLSGNQHNLMDLLAQH